MENHNAEQDKFIVEIKTNVKWIVREIKDIKNNHLKSIYSKIDDLEKQQNARPTWLMLSLATLLGSLIVYLLTVQ